MLRKGLPKACLQCINDDEPFTVECHAYNLAIGATLNQSGRPVAFMNRTLTKSERRYPSVEKKATAIIEAVRKLAHFLHARPFTLITNQQSVFPCRNMTTQTVITCLTTLFCSFGFPSFVLTEHGSYFSSKEFKDFLHLHGIATSRTILYYPSGNSQSESWNQTTWRTIKLMLHSKQMPEETWEIVLQDALHFTRSLLCTSTNSTPTKIFFVFNVDRCKENRCRIGCLILDRCSFAITDKTKVIFCARK